MPSPNPGLYVHIPFCRSKCPYCDFYSIVSKSLIQRWLEALKKEIIYYKGQFTQFDTLYLGGGTPSLLDPMHIETILETLFSNFDFAKNCEITIEANPCDLSRDKIKSLKGLGFNRISVGAQSFEDKLLTFLGRKHTVKDIKKSIKILRSFDYKNISLDLIYGFKEQTLNTWKKSLEQALSFEPEHISCYQLTIANGTPFKRKKDKGLLKILSQDDEASFFLFTSEFLEGHGYKHYEISSFAKNNHFFSRHNQKYWQHIPYLGLGPGAHSFNNKSRWWNISSVKRYCDLLDDGQPPVEISEDLTDDQLRLEHIFLGLRTKAGIEINLISHGQQNRVILSGLEKKGFIKLEKGRLMPTRKGFLVADQLSLMF